MNISRSLYLSICCISLILAGCTSSPIASTEVEKDSATISSMSASGLERSIVQITDDIYRFFNNHHSSLFVVTEEGVIFIDPLNPAAARWANGEIEAKFGKPVTHVLYSHGHEDHASGAREFGDVEVISHINTFDVITPPEDQILIHGYDSYDENNNGVIDMSENVGPLQSTFGVIDTNSDDTLTGQETETYFFRNVVPPTKTYDANIYRTRINGKLIEMHHVDSNHANDTSYIFFPEESIVFYVDIISLGALPFGPLPWYSLEDNNETYEKALSIGADIAIPSHGPVGTQDDVRALKQYMADLREQVGVGIDSDLSLEEIQTTVTMQDYADWDFYDDRIAQNIAGMYRVLMEEREG